LHNFYFVRRQAVKLIHQRVYLAIQRGAFIFVEILVLVALRAGKLRLGRVAAITCILRFHTAKNS
jgi:hypothetical protein